MSVFDRGLVTLGTAAGLVGAMLGAVWAEPCPNKCSFGKVPLGITVPMTGPGAMLGWQSSKAVEIAVRGLNAAGGLIGVPVELVVGDDQCDPGMAVRVATRHVERVRIGTVIGPICPTAVMDTAPIYAKAGVIQFVPTMTAVELTRRNFDTVFRMAANDEQEAQALAAYLEREQKGKKLSVVYGDIFYRRAMAERVKAAISAEVKASARFEPLHNYDRLVDALQRDPPDIIYMALDAAPLIEVVRKLRARGGVKSLVIGGQHLLSQTFWRIAGATAEGIHVIAPIGSLSDSEYRKALDVLRQVDVAPDLVALYSYAAVQTWVEAVRRAGSGDRKKVIEALRSSEYITAVGRVAFDSKGDRRDISYSVLTWRRGRLELGTAQQGAVPTPPVATPSQAISRPAATLPEEVLRFEQPLPFGPFPVNGKTIKQLADSIPLFPPIEGQNEALWKKNCSTCHKWDRQALCQQGASYLANPRNVLRLQHPFGGSYKVALMRWSKSGCQ